MSTLANYCQLQWLLSFLSGTGSIAQLQRYHIALADRALNLCLSERRSQGRSHLLTTAQLHMATVLSIAAATLHLNGLPFAQSV